MLGSKKPASLSGRKSQTDATCSLHHWRQRHRERHQTERAQLLFFFFFCPEKTQPRHCCQAVAGRGRTHMHGGGERKRQGCCAPGCSWRPGRLAARQETGARQFNSEFPPITLK